MKFNFSKLNEPVWFYFDDQPENGGVCIRVAPSKEVERICRICSTKQPAEYRGGVRYEIPDKVDDKKYSQMIWDYVIYDWDILDENGNKPELTIENKYKLMSEEPAFSTFVVQKLETLKILQSKREDESEKNL